MQGEFFETVPPPAMSGLEMEDEEAGVVSCPVEELPDWIKEQFLESTPFESVCFLAFFYHPGADAVVLNRSHKYFEAYRMLVTAYLKFDENTRAELRQKCPAESIRPSFDIMDAVIRERKKHGRLKV